MADLKKRKGSASRFAMVPRADVPRSAFDISHTHKTTFEGGDLVPVYVDEVLPGDSKRLRMTAFCRLATPFVPIMDNMYLESFFFFVPNRLLWEHWEAFMGEQATPSDTTAYLVPYLSAPGLVGSRTIYDYMGVMNMSPSGAPLTHQVNALPFRAYNLIWNTWFRDEDLQTPVAVDVTDGPDVTGYSLLKRGKRHDYFTSARPWPQKPTPNFDTGSLGLYGPGGRYSFANAGAPVSGLGVATGTAPAAGGLVATTGNREVTYPLVYGTSATQLYLKAQSAGNYPDLRVLVNDIRTANMIQMMMERNARGGTRYAEIVRSHFGVVSPDQRLQRPEYLGGGRTPVNINPVAQTSATGVAGTTTALGELAAIGTAVAQNHGFSQSFTEHGVIIGLVNVRADLSYQQGIHRMWKRRSRYDFYWPGLAHLGEQAIRSYEIYADGQGTEGSSQESGANAATLDYSVFGYQERWAEYRYKPNRISGQFRSDTPGGGLDVWHLAEDFASRPVLNATFIQDDPPLERVLQVYGEDDFLLDALFFDRMVRPMPMYSIPGLGPRL